MLFPIRDSVPSKIRPVVSYGIITLCTLVFFWELTVGGHLQSIFQTAAFIPARLFDSVAPAQMPLANYGVGGNLVTILVSLFMHGGWMHLISNMWFLYIFGDNVEDALGHGRYLLFFLAGGVAATMSHAVANPTSVLPIVGASGAVGAVLGAYVVWHPRSRVHTLVFLGFFITTIEVPAIVYLGFWFILQVIQGALTAGAGTYPAEVAWFAHIGGFGFGCLVAAWARLQEHVNLQQPS